MNRPTLVLTALLLISVAGGAVATETSWSRSPGVAQAPPSPTAADLDPDSVDGAAPPAGPTGHAERLALFRERLAAFRVLEPGLWPSLRGRAPHTARAAGTHASPPPLTATELAAAKTRPDADCLTQAIYYEARSESQVGQAAVAQVVLNRARSGLYPKSVCGVVFQGADRRGCQFSFACDGAIRRGVADRAAWDRAREVASRALDGTAAEPGIGSALNYHADYVRPTWSQQLARVAEIGRHVFYRARDGLLPPGATAPAPTQLDSRDAATTAATGS